MGGGDSLYDKIDRGMRGCKAVVSCITQKYSLSANCRREISLADALKKPIIPLMFEQMKWPPDGPMSMVFTELLYINFFSDEKIQMVWKGEKVNELIEKLGQFIPEITLTSEKKGKGTHEPSPQSKANVRNEHQTEKNADDTKNDMTVSKTNSNPAAVSTNKGKPTRNKANVRNEHQTEKNADDTKNDMTVSKTNGITATVSTNKDKPTRNKANVRNEHQTEKNADDTKNDMTVSKTNGITANVSTNKDKPTRNKANVRNEHQTEKNADDTKNDMTVSKTNGITATVSTNKGKPTRNVASNSQSKTNQSSNNTEQVPTPKPSGRGNEKQTNDTKSNVSNGMNKAKPKAQIAATENRDIKASVEKPAPTSFARGNRHYKGNIHVEKDEPPDQSIVKTNAKNPDTVTNGTKTINKEDTTAQHGQNSRKSDNTKTSVGTTKHQQKEISTNNAENKAGPKTENKQQGADKSKSPPKKMEPANNQNTTNNQKQINTEISKPTSKSCAIL